jgi:hypothetical protein
MQNNVIKPVPSPEFHSPNSNLLEYALSVLFSVGSLMWAHLTNTDGIFFKIVVAPAVAASIGFFVARLLKRIFPEKKS